jgi:PhnB protein
MNTSSECSPSAVVSTGVLQVLPYLSFDGRTDEALEFYQQALDADVLQRIRFGDRSETCDGHPVNPEKIMHATFRVGAATLFASDCHCGGKPSFEGISLAMNVADDAEAELRFARLSEGGRVFQPLTQTFFSSRFGVVADRFGVTWMIAVAPAAS